jgi:hypothetical protein
MRSEIDQAVYEIAARMATERSAASFLQASNFSKSILKISVDVLTKTPYSLHG